MNDSNFIQPADYQDEYGDDYLRYYKGTIYLLEEDDEQTEIGEVEFFMMDGNRALNNNIDIVVECDSLGQDEYDYAKSIYKDGVIDEKFIELGFSNNILALHELAILPEYRGHDYGLSIAKKIFDTFGSHCAAMVLRPMPFQFASFGSDEKNKARYKLNAFSLSESDALKKVTAYWKKLGLKKTNDPGIFYKGNL